LRSIRRSGASGKSLAVQLRELLARPLVEALDERDAAAPPERRREKSKHPSHRQISHLQCSPGYLGISNAIFNMAELKIEKSISVTVHKRAVDFLIVFLRNLW
jgi:hypothetical protein